MDPTTPVLLKTKMSPPLPKEHVVDRGRLTDTLTRALQGRLTLLSAPAGSGKTTLLAQWVHTHDNLVAWLSVDARDNDPIRFWRYAIHSLASAAPESVRKKLLPLAHALPSLSLATFLDAFINELDELPETIAFLLDDYHLIEDKRIHESVAYFVDYLPDTVRLLISSRSGLPFPTVKWMAKEQHTEIDARQLQFTAAETAAFCRDWSGNRSGQAARLTEQQIETLTLRTEGWATGLQLVSLSLRSETNVDRFLDEFQGDHRHIADYLLHEVAANLPSDLFRFMLITSVLDRMDATVCDAVTGEKNSAAMLDDARKRNLFLVPLDDRNVWYRYHHLFGRFLQELLKRNDYRMWLQANRLASECLAERGLMDEAIGHALAAEDYSLAESFLMRHIPAVLERGELVDLLRWFESIPDSHSVSPELALLHALIRVLTGDAPRAERELQQVEHACSAMAISDRRKQLQSGILFVRSNLVFASGEFDKWLAFRGGIMDDILPANPTYYNFNYNLTEPLVRRTPLGLRGVLTPETEQIGSLFAGALESHGWQESLIHLYVKQSLSEGYYEWNRLDESRELLLQLSRTSAVNQIPGLLVPLHLTQASLCMAEGNYELAHAAVDEAAQMVANLADTHWLDALRVFKTRIYLRKGQLANAKKTFAPLGLTGKDKPAFKQEFEYMTLARLLGKQGKEAEAVRLLELLKPQTEREQLLSGLIDLAILRALLEEQRGQRTDALRYLHEALVWGEKNGYIRSFVDEGIPMKALLAAYLKDESRFNASIGQPVVTSAYVRRLLESFPEEYKKKTEHKTALAEPLSLGEIELLHLVRQGLTNKQMAAQLALSEGTVKVYLSRLYEKLGVSSRTQALIAVQEIRLPE